MEYKVIKHDSLSFEDIFVVLLYVLFELLYGSLQFRLIEFNLALAELSAGGAHDAFGFDFVDAEALVLILSDSPHVLVEGLDI